MILTLPACSSRVLPSQARQLPLPPRAQILHGSHAAAGTCSNSHSIHLTSPAPASAVSRSPHARSRAAIMCRAVPGSRLEQVLSNIDEANAQDPRTVEVDGQLQPYELAYSRWLGSWVERLTADGAPAASEEVQIVARGQHVERWKSPRSSYPDGKIAYFKWREDLKKAHSARVVGFMSEAGYPQESLDKVERLILKKELGQPEGQVIEDALCLVFLERQFAEFRLKETRAGMLVILRRTWAKMGPKGHAAALALPLGPEEAELVGAALSGGL